MTAAGPPLMPDLCDRRQKLHYVTAIIILHKLGVDPGAVHLRAVGPFLNYRGEVHSQEPAPGTPLHPDTEISLDVGYSSVVDYLPYQFFHGLEGVSRLSSVHWEDRARALMAPFDGSVIRWTAEARHEVIRFSGGATDRRHVLRVLDLFGFSLETAAMTTSEALFWLTVMPTFNNWSGNPARVARILQAVFGLPFSIAENVPLPQEIPQDIQTRLGQQFSRLGNELVLGREYTDRDNGCEVVVHEVPADRAADWIEGGACRQRLANILEFSMPGHMDCRIRIEVREEPAPLGEGPAGAYLGASLRLHREPGAAAVRPVNEVDSTGSRL